MAKYLKQGAQEEYTEDSAEIQYLKFNMVRHAALGYMLGDFDERGEYNIDPEIVNELIFMPKYFVDNMENADICHSVLTLNAPLTFLVTFENDAATLSLVEKLSYEGNFKFNSGSYSNINEYILDVVTTNGNLNKEAVYRRWHISQYGGNVLDIRNLDEKQLQAFYGLAARFKYLTYVNAMFAQKEEQLELAETNYSNSLLDLLKQYPELNSAVMESVKDALNKTEILRLDKPNFSKTLNEVLDTAIEFNIGLLDEQQIKDFKTQRHNIQQARNVKAEEAIPLEVSHLTVDNKETAIGSPKVQTFREETTLSFFALDEQLKQEQQKAEQNAENRAVNVLNGRNKPNALKSALEIGTAALAGYVLGAIAHDIILNTGKRVQDLLVVAQQQVKPENLVGGAVKGVVQEQAPIVSKSPAISGAISRNSNKKATTAPKKKAATNKNKNTVATPKASPNTNKADRKSTAYTFTSNLGKTQNNATASVANQQRKNDIRAMIARINRDGQSNIGAQTDKNKNEVGLNTSADKSLIGKHSPSAKRVSNSAPNNLIGSRKATNDIFIAHTDDGLTR